jgi:FkbM family methyltransferase
MNDAEKFDLLRSLLRQDPASVAQQAARAFDTLAGESPRIVLFGAGGLGRKIAAGLRELGIEPLAFADNDARLHGTMLLGLPVLSPQEAATRYGSSAVFVVTIWRAYATETLAERLDSLRALGCQKVCSFFTLAWKYPEHFLPHYCAELPSKVIADAEQILRTSALWSDPASMREYVEQILWRIDPERFPLSAPTTLPIYFPPDLVRLGEAEVYVDCGGFDGDTARDFLGVVDGRFGRIEIVEPDPSNVVKIESWRATLPAEAGARITVHNVALGDEPGIVRFQSNSAVDSRIAADGTIEIQCEKLDTLLAASAPTIIKMDIEGAEESAVRSARRLIAAHRPILTICLYHTQHHVWEIPALIHSFAPDYRFHLKNHGLDAWELVLYAIPAERAIS